MHYHFSCTISGETDKTLDDLADLDESPIFQSASLLTLPLTPKYPTYRQMFRQRPRIRFNGCYISTVNYTRPGAAAATSVTWNTPVLMVTYYRYLRFFRDGSLISLLTTNEPADVVPYLYAEHLHHSHTGALPQSVMKDALRGRWRLSGNPWKAPVTGEEETEEPEGDVIVETDGVRPKYMYKMHLALGSAGKGTRNNKLTWRGYWSWNRLTDDWASFELKHDKAFYWSRVRSFGTGL
jgi:F-box protein 9